MRVGESPSADAGPHDDTTVTHLQWKRDGFSVWIMHGPTAWQSWTADGQIAPQTFETEVTILQISAFI